MPGTGRGAGSASARAHHARGAQATLKQQDDEVSRLNGELTQLSVSHEDLRQSLEEQEATVLGLWQAAEDTRQALKAEKKQVEGELSFVVFSFIDLPFLGIRSQFFVSRLWLSGLRVTLGNSTTQAQAMQTAYNSSQQELEELRAAALETFQEIEEGEAQAMSVRNVVPTLTSNERRDLPLDGPVLATNDTGFYPGSGRGCTSSSGVLEALYCFAP
jgi:hypothetical protein